MSSASFAQSNSSAISPDESPNLKATINFSVDIFPNPVSEYLIIDLFNVDAKELEIDVYNIIGNRKEIEMEQITSDRLKINTEEFNPGYYLLVVKDNKNRYNQAFKFQKK